MLDALLNPGSIAVIGASHTPGKVGYEIFSNLLKSGFKGIVRPVNPNVTSVLGVQTYKSVKDIETDIDLAVIATPAESVPKLLGECVEKKVKSAIIVSGGFSEIGERGAKLEKELKAIAGKGKVRVLGPNVFGVYNSYNGLNALLLAKERMRMPEKGYISIVTQSGSVGSTIMDILGERRIGVSKFVSYGNALDIDESDLVEYLGNDPSTKVIVMFVEGVKDGRKFINAVKAVGRRKPIIILKGGKTKRGSSAALSHTSSMAGSYKTYSSVFKQFGLLEAKTWEELLDYSKAFLQRLPKGDRMAIVTDSGGWGVLATDEAEKAGLALPEPSDKLKSALATHTTQEATLCNPIDLAADATVERYRRVMEEILKSEEYDGLILVALFQVPTLETTVVDAIEGMKAYGKPILCCSAGSEFSTRLVRSLESRGIPVYESPERAVRAMKALVEYGRISQKK